MGHRIPLSRDASHTAVVLHRQAMIEMAHGRGFRPDYMERQLVALGQADPLLLQPEQSDRSKRKAAAKRAFREKYRRTGGIG